MVERQMNHELEQIWKEPSVAQQRYYPRTFFGGTVENYKENQVRIAPGKT
jgi:hypothetical protein